jgi:aerobic carbon-monoxide dehydrogenase large subunit
MPESPPRSVAARFVGQSVVRKEDRRLLTGHGRYVDDVTAPRIAFGAFLRSDVAKGTITRLDVSAAEAIDGVLAVFTGERLLPHHGQGWHAMLGPEMLTPPPLAVGSVKHVGDPIAFVVAISRYVAEDALEAIEVDIDVVEAAVDYRTAGSDTDSIVHGDWGLTSNYMVEAPFTPLSPDLDQVFANAAHVVEAKIEQHRYLAVPMETRGILADYDPGNDSCHIVLSGQSSHGARDYFSRYLNVPEQRVSVDLQDVGGGFGQKMFVSREECAVVLASKLLGRPVKWIEDRRENLISAGHSRNESGLVRMAIDQDGTIQAMTIDHKNDVGAYPICPAGLDSSLLPGPYKVPRYGFKTALVWTNTMGKAAYRGPWMFETTAREMMMDIAAREIGLDPVEFRRKNLLSSSDLPFTNPAGQTFVEATPLESLDAALDALDYEAFRRDQASARDEGRYLGLGISVYIEPTSMGARSLHSEGATVRVESDGSITAYLGTASHGQSVETTMAQVIADTLGGDYEKVTVVQGTTQGTPWGGGTGGSRTAVVAGGAARTAALQVRTKMLAIAAHVMEASPDDLVVDLGVISVAGSPGAASITLEEVAEFVYTDPSSLPPDVEPGIEATVRFQPNRFPTWSNATHLCVVDIDAATCETRVVRYIVAEDCGKMINPQVVEGQVYGGVVQGLGGVLLENFVYDERGNPLTTTFMDYLLPTTTEIPLIEVIHMDSESTSNPGGYKGMGEGGAIGAHAAAANAVADALAHLGVRVTSTPLGPNDIHQLIQAARAAATP